MFGSCFRVSRCLLQSGGRKDKKEGHANIVGMPHFILRLERHYHLFSYFVQEASEKIKIITTKLQRLLEGYLEQDIEKETYREQKAVLLSEKKSLEEKMARIEQKQNDWLEPMEKWINYAQNQWAALRAAHELASKKPFSFVLVGPAGLEPVTFTMST